MVAGAQYRGQFEQRLKAVLAEAAQAILDGRLPDGSTVRATLGPDAAVALEPVAEPVPARA